MNLYSLASKNSAYESHLLTTLGVSFLISIVHAITPNEMHQMRHYLGQNPVGHFMATNAAGFQSSRLQRNIGNKDGGYDPKRRAIEHFNRLMEDRGKDIRYEFPDTNLRVEESSQNISRMLKLFTAQETTANNADEMLIPAVTPELSPSRSWVKVDPFLLFIGTVMILLAAALIVLNCFCHFGKHKTTPGSTLLRTNLIENPFQRLSHLTAI